MTRRWSSPIISASSATGSCCACSPSSPAFVFAFAVHGRIIELLTRPLPDGKRLVTLGVTEPFATSVKVSLLAACALVLPLALAQFWAFLAPALSPAAQRAIVGFVVLASALFAAGVLFAYAVVLPRALAFLVGFDDHLYDVQIRASYYYAFAAMTLFATGLAFQLPIALLGLVRLGALSVESLRRNRRTAYVVLVACTILLPTVDPVSLAWRLRRCSCSTSCRSASPRSASGGWSASVAMSATD
jgi:sec-independent protein translocase protein TatC